MVVRSIGRLRMKVRVMVECDGSVGKLCFVKMIMLVDEDGDVLNVMVIDLKREVMKVVVLEKKRLSVDILFV